MRLPAQFVRSIEQHSQAKDWGENPLLFSMAAYVFAVQGKLTREQKHALSRHHRCDSQYPFPNDPDHSYQTKRALAELSLQLFRYYGRTFTRKVMGDQLLRVSARLNEQWLWPDMLKQIIESGLLDVVANETYTFRHQTFMEYLAAEALHTGWRTPKRCSIKKSSAF